MTQMNQAIYGETPAEVWCAKCERPATEVIETQLGTRSFCGLHAFQVEAPNFNARGTYPASKGA